jgi:hypothetical protein
MAVYGVEISNSERTFVAAIDKKRNIMTRSLIFLNDIQHSLLHIISNGTQQAGLSLTFV